MQLLPRRYASFAYAVIQAAITTGAATAIATLQSRGTGLQLLGQWAVSWLIAWLTMLPVVLLVAPMIERAVTAVTAPDAAPQRNPTAESADS